MKDWSREITIPKPGWFVTVSKFWWEDWKDWLNADSDIPLCLDDRYRLGWSDFSEKDWNAEPFLVVSSKIDIAYVKSIGCIPNVEVHFLVGEKLKHIFAEAKKPELLNGIFLRLKEDYFTWQTNPNHSKL